MILLSQDTLSHLQTVNYSFCGYQMERYRQTLQTRSFTPLPVPPLPVRWWPASPGHPCGHTRRSLPAGGWRVWPCEALWWRTKRLWTLQRGTAVHRSLQSVEEGQGMRWWWGFSSWVRSMVVKCLGNMGVVGRVDIVTLTFNFPIWKFLSVKLLLRLKVLWRHLGFS